MFPKMLIVVTICATLATVRAATVGQVSARIDQEVPTPHDHTFALYNANIGSDSRYADLLEDANLKVPELIKKYRYPVEVHSVTTSDGYILEMHRIPHGRDQNNVPDKNKPVAFIMHGLLASSAAWVLMGPSSGLAYTLAEEGYDVWMGNARGNRYSRRHTSLNPDANFGFWQFSWDEIGNFDLPSMIDYILDHTGKQKLHYIGHSQGTTSFFVMASLRPEYNDKITSMQALAPVAYMEHNQMPLLQFISHFSNKIEKILSLFGVGEFLADSNVYRWAGQALCRDKVVTQAICSNIMFLIGGWNEAQHNATMLPVIFGHCPAGASVRQLAHYGQGISGKEFRRYDHGCFLYNLKAYRSFKPPHYDLSKITAPVFLHYSDNDSLAHVKDVERLFSELGKPVGKFRVPLATFTHMDFMWAVDVKELLYNRLLKFMSKAEGDINNIDVDNL